MTARGIVSDEISCIAISGLGGHAFGSFKEREGSHMWLRDSLPFDLPGVRIMLYGYDTRLHDSRSFQDLETLASSLRPEIETISSTANGEHEVSTVKRTRKS